MHREFEAFIKSVEETAKDYNVVFDKPYRDLGFEGNWNRARMFLQPTLSTLMNVIEAPFFILTINEVEIACFERVMVYQLFISISLVSNHLTWLSSSRTMRNLSSGSNP